MSPNKPFDNTLPRATTLSFVGGARTPQGRFRGHLASLDAIELGALAVAGALGKSGVGRDQVDAVIMGQVLQTGAGQNPAKQTAIQAGIGWNVRPLQ